MQRKDENPPWVEVYVAGNATIASVSTAWISTTLVMQHEPDCAEDMDMMKAELERRANATNCIITFFKVLGPYKGKLNATKG